MARLTKEQIAARNAIAEKKKKLKPDIALWKPGPGQNLIEDDNKIFLVHFEKIFGSPKAKQFDRFIVDKTSYTNQLDIITEYVNYFMNKYDPENDLAMAYYKIKVEMDKYRAFNEENMEEFIDLIYNLLFHPRMCDKIRKLVNDNYLDDIEKTDGNEKYKGYNKQYLESLEFTNEHVKIMHMISFGMKMMSPLILHYLHLNVIKLDHDSEILYQFYKGLFPLFGGEINIYNKLFIYIKTKVMDNRVHNVRIYDQRNIMGTDDYQVMKYFLRKVIISENMVKYKFNSTYDVKQKKYKENVIGFNKTIIKYQLWYFLKQPYSKNITEVTNIKNSDGLSGADKLEMNMSKMDEGAVILSEINAKTTFDRIIEDTNFNITEEEIDYYLDHFKIHPFQAIFIRNYYASCFGNMRDIQNLSRRDFYKLTITLKKYLIMQEQYNPDKFHGKECPLAYILTGNMSEKLINRIIRNSKFNSSLDENESWQFLVNSKYHHLSEIYPEELNRLVSTFVSTEFTYVSYENQEMTGKEIEYEDYKISEQLISYVRAF